MTDHTSPLIALCAGEASGDLLGAHLIAAVRRRCPDARFIGIGGPRMTAAGLESLFDQERLAVRGYVEVLKRLPEILRIRRRLIARLKALKPAVFVGIDAPDFNLGVAERLKAAGVPTVHYVSPSVWAWKRERVHTIVKQVNQVLCLFPMEPQLYREAGGRALFVGHPLAQTLPFDADKAAARARLKLADDAPVFALLPGSRVSEIDYMAPLFLRTAALLLRELPEAQFLLPYPTAAARERLKHYLAQPEFEKLPVRLQAAKTELACTAADVVLVTSGTATLEVALCKRPMVISYKISPLTYLLVRRKIKVPHVGLPNILLGREAVPELLQRKAKPELLSAAVLEWYRQPEKTAALADTFGTLHHILQGGGIDLAAQAVLAEAGLAVAAEDDACHSEELFALLQYSQRAADTQPENGGSTETSDNAEAESEPYRQPENHSAESESKPETAPPPGQETLLFFKHNQQPTYAMVRTVGSSENLLRLTLAEEAPAEPFVRALSLHPYGGEPCLRSAEVVQQVALGVQDAEARCGRPFHIAEIGFVPNDAPPVSVYRTLAETLLARVDADGGFIITNFTD